MRIICLTLFIPVVCIAQHVVLNDHGKCLIYRYFDDTLLEIEQFLSSEIGKQLDKAGIANCIRRDKKSPINVNIGKIKNLLCSFIGSFLVIRLLLANATLTSNPPLIMKNYLVYENVTETELSNVTGA